MIKVGLTGNIGSGKSTVARIFEILGVPVYHADREAKKFLIYPDVINKLTHRFGPEILEANQINRKKLADIVFYDSESLNFLNGLIHPLVRDDLQKWISTVEHNPYFVQEAAILFESGFHTFFDVTVVVTCPREIAIERIIQRDGTDEKAVLARIEKQWPEEKKIELSDFVIDNSGAELLIPRVLEIHSKFLAMSEQ
jgi:dephospho-CoA kinase